MKMMKIFGNNHLKQMFEASGYKWWITDDKEVYFQPDFNYTAAPYEIDNDRTNINRLTDLRKPKYNEKLADFRTREFVVGKKVAGVSKLGSAFDPTLETKMSSYYGSGVYGHVTINRNITTQTDANVAAYNILKSYSNIPGEFSFETAISGFDVRQILKITFPILGIDTETEFLIDNISIVDYGPDVIYHVHAIKKIVSVSDKPRQKNDWTEEIGKLKGDGASQDTFEKYLYTSNELEDIVGTGGSVYTLEPTLEVNAHVFTHLTVRGLSSADQYVYVTLSILDTPVYIGKYNLKSGDNTFTFAYPAWGVEAGADIDFDLEIKTSTGTFTVSPTDLIYWINTTGLVGNVAVSSDIEIEVEITKTAISSKTITDSVTVVTT